MREGLEKCRATLRRVETKLGQLKRSINRYHTNSHVIVPQDDLQNGERLFCLKQVKQPPLSISIQVTEITCLMRAALDHLMYLIIWDSLGHELPAGEFAPYFPIYKNEDDFDKQMAKLNRNYGLQQDVADWLRSHQGYSSPNLTERTLIILNSIVGIAKHRFHNAFDAKLNQTTSRLTGISGVSDGMQVENNIINGIQLRSFRIERAAFEEGAIVARAILGKDVVGPLQMGGGMGIHLVGGTSTGPIVQETMDSIMRQLDINFTLSQRLEFSPGAGVPANVDAHQLLSVVNRSLRDQILGKNFVTDRF